MREGPHVQQGRPGFRHSPEEWLRRIPEFSLAPDGAVTWSQGTVRGPRRLPLALSARSRTGRKPAIVEWNARRPPASARLQAIGASDGHG
jgi:hypothetical protein